MPSIKINKSLSHLASSFFLIPSVMRVHQLAPRATSLEFGFCPETVCVAPPPLRGGFTERGEGDDLPTEVKRVIPTSEKREVESRGCVGGCGDEGDYERQGGGDEGEEGQEGDGEELLKSRWRGVEVVSGKEESEDDEKTVEQKAREEEGG
jgi:hypothetical protein